MLPGKLWGAQSVVAASSDRGMFNGFVRRTLADNTKAMYAATKLLARMSAILDVQLFNPKMNSVKYLVWFLGLGSVVLLIFCALTFFVLVADVRSTHAWPKVTAVVEAVDVVKSERGRSRAGGYCRRTSVVYTLEGKTHRAIYEDTGTSCHSSEAVVEFSTTAFPVGRVLDVYANPSKPEQVRSIKYSYNYLVLFLIGLAGLAAAAQLFALVYFDFHKKPAA